MIYKFLIATAFLLALNPLVMSQTPLTRAEKQEALHNSVSWIPYGQTINQVDLPSSALRMDWMRRVRDTQPLSLISIPATHDAGTALGMTGSTRCQVLTIPAQLAVGIRGFDVRLRLVKSKLMIYHSLESQKLEFTAVMKSFQAFLKKHPSECIIMRVKEEMTAIKPTSSFLEAFESHIQPYSSLFYRATGRTDIPTLGALRGKILVLDNYGKIPNAVDYPNPTMAVQDDYDTSDMAKKLSEILQSFELAGSRKDGAVWDVNYTSSCTDKVDQIANAHAVNDKVRTYLHGKRGNLGLVLFNFPSVDVIHSVIDSNF